MSVPVSFDVTARVRPMGLVGVIAFIVVVGVSWAATAGQPSAGVRLDRAALASLVTELRADERRDLNGVIVSLDGAITLEAYLNGEGPDTLHDMRSAGKSITSLAVGIAIDRGLVLSVDARLTTLLPEPRAPDKAQIRLEDVLTIRQIVSERGSDAA